MLYSMASRAAASFRTAAAAQGYNLRRQAAAGSGSRSAAMATAAAHPASKGSKLRGDMVPVYISLGLIALSVTLGVSTARQQLAHAPNVRVDKKKRAATVPEVAAPDLALDEGERFVGRSLFRKVAHVQGDRSLAAGVADPVADYPAGRNKAVTLKDAGVDTPGVPSGERGGVIDAVVKKQNSNGGGA